MSPVKKTGLYYPNKFGLIIIKSLEEVMGKNGLNAILNLGGLNNYIENEDHKWTHTIYLTRDYLDLADLDVVEFTVYKIKHAFATTKDD